MGAGVSVGAGGVGTGVSSGTAVAVGTGVSAGTAVAVGAVVGLTVASGVAVGAVGDGNPVDLKAFLAAATAAEGEEPVIDENMALDVFEFGPIVAGNYVEEYGKITANMLFSTPYEKDQKVAVLIGIAKVNDEKKSQLAEGEELNSDCIDDIEWVAFEGVGQDAVEDQEETYGCIKVELTPEIVLAIQQAAEEAGTTALMAVVSQAAETEAAE